MGVQYYAAKVDRIVQDKANMLEGYRGFVLEALTLFSKDYPQVIVADITGDGGYEYDFPATWVEDDSVLKQVEYPANEREPTYLEAEDYQVYREAAGTDKLRFFSDSPTAAQTIRITFTTPWTKTTIDNIPAAKQDAFLYLAAFLCCEALARLYAQNQDTTIDADATDGGSMSDRYARRAKELKATYNTLMDKTKGVKAASGVIEWDVNYPWGGDRLTHPRKNR